MTQKLRVFLCHASQDKPAVRGLYKRLAAETWIDPWLDEEKILPGQDWNLEIQKAIHDAEIIIVCLSKESVAKEGYVQREFRIALDLAQEKPEGTIYVIPLKLTDCSIPSRFKQWQWVDYFTPNAYGRLLKSLHLRTNTLKIETSEVNAESVVEFKPVVSQDDRLDLYHFVEIQLQKDAKVSYPFWIGKYPVTNAQYERFLNAPDFANSLYWLEFSKFDMNCKPIGHWERTGVDWLKKQLKESRSNILLPRYWDDKNFGISNPNHPVVGISWYEANAYSEWLFQNWDNLSESNANPTVKPRAIRLPLETEWVIAAGGELPPDRYPWDEAGKSNKLLKDKLRRSNTSDSGIGHTTPVNAYHLGKSSLGVMDMAGNVWEWQANYYGLDQDNLGLRGGSWDNEVVFASIWGRNFLHPSFWSNSFGFRLVLLPSG